MNKAGNIFIIICIVALVSLYGCSSTKTGKSTGATVTTAAGVMKAAGDVPATTQAAAKVATTLSDADWCKQGGKWHVQGTATDLDILEVESAGKYKGYCHMTYTLSSGGISSTIHYFLKQDGAGFQYFEINGQKFELPINN